MNHIGLEEVERSNIVVSFKKSHLLLISHHGALCIPVTISTTRSRNIPHQANQFASRI